MLRRRFAFSYLLAYALTVALAPVADAEREAAAAVAVPHVEELGSSCPPAHDHFTCRLCRVVRADAERLESIRMPIVTKAARAVATSVAARIDHASTAPNSARAPPAA